MPHPDRSVLTDVTAVADRLFAASDQPVLLDVRWTLAGADENAYRQGHIPGALFVDLDAELAAAPGPGGRHPLPAPADLQRLWRELGIDDASEVVVYDAADSSVAARAWWLLRWSGHDAVQVLDGGFTAWTAENRAVEMGDRNRPDGGTATVRPGGMPTVGIDDVSRASRTGEPVLLDARAAARYRGEVEPIDPVAGHIPGAVNLPFADLVDANGRFRSTDDIDDAFRSAGIGVSTSAAASCGSGVTACHLVLAGAITGRSLALFPQSYSGWCAAGLPVETG